MIIVLFCSAWSTESFHLADISVHTDIAAWAISKAPVVAGVLVLILLGRPVRRARGICARVPSPPVCVCWCMYRHLGMRLSLWGRASIQTRRTDPEAPVPTLEVAPEILLVHLSLAPGESRSCEFSLLCLCIRGADFTDTYMLLSARQPATDLQGAYLQ